MTKVCWLTDIHLDVVDDDVRQRLFAQIEASEAQAVVITGDIADGPKTVDHLTQMADRLVRPIYFVLGNHDYYSGAIDQAEVRAARLAAGHQHLVYLPTAKAVGLSPDWGLIGCRSWPDARLGDFEGSKVFLPDFVTIEDLAAVRHDRTALRALLAQLGDQTAYEAAKSLAEAFQKFPKIVLATHVPPFHQAARHNGRPCDDDWLPYFSCRAMGDVLLAAMSVQPERRLLVLCGHTHGGGRARLLDNLEVFTGGAESGRPTIQKVFEFNGAGVHADGPSW